MGATAHPYLPLGLASAICRYEYAHDVYPPAAHTDEVTMRDYLDAAVGAVSKRLDATDAAAAEQHARVELRLSNVESAIQHTGERLGAVEQELKHRQGIEDGKRGVVMPVMNGVVMPVMVALVLLILGGAAIYGISSVTAKREAESQVTPTASAFCSRSVSQLAAERVTLKPTEYAQEVADLAAAGCDVSAALVR